MKGVKRVYRLTVKINTFCSNGMVLQEHAKTYFCNKST